MSRVRVPSPAPSKSLRGKGLRARTHPEQVEECQPCATFVPPFRAFARTTPCRHHAPRPRATPLPRSLFSARTEERSNRAAHSGQLIHPILILMIREFEPLRWIGVKARLEGSTFSSAKRTRLEALEKRAELPGNELRCGWKKRQVSSAKRIHSGKRSPGGGCGQVAVWEGPAGKSQGAFHAASAVHSLHQGGRATRQVNRTGGGPGCCLSGCFARRGGVAERAPLEDDDVGVMEEPVHGG
jgi:hypothetical protein